jgi:2,4-diketo-3-deoxy-L-fuconate hydrolase
LRLVTFANDGDVLVGARVEDGIVPLPFPNMVSLIRAGEEGLEAARAAAESGTAIQARVLAPLRPGKILASGPNYASHAQENPGAALPTEPFFFSKLPSAVIGPTEPIVVPYPETQTDWEVELAIVVGRRAKRLSAENALEAIFGWTILNDISARDVQLSGGQLTMGKCPDTFAPLGPEIVTADELGDWSTLRLWTTVNGETMQDAPTSEMLFTPGRMLEFITSLITLEAGDVVSTGTPAGVALFRDPPPYLKPGDVVTVGVDRIGELTNPVVAGW